MHFILMYTEKGFRLKSKYCEDIIGYHKEHLYCVLEIVLYMHTMLSDDDEYEKDFQGK